MKTLDEILESIKNYTGIPFFYIDLFCGAGGVTTGIEQAIVDGKKVAKVVLCINHDPNAIYSHNANHKDALHFIEDIRTLDLQPAVILVNTIRQLHPDSHIVLHASLECTNHSRAKGGMSRDADSRTLADHLIRYIDILKPDYITIENVVEFMLWGPLIVKVKKTPVGEEYCPLEIKKDKKGKVISLNPVWVPDPDRLSEYYDKWTGEIKRYGYNFDHRVLNAADFGSRTRRKRYFGQFARYGLPISWPEQTHCKNGSKNLFSNLAPWKPVKDVLELDQQGESIFDKNYCEKTLTRINNGLNKFYPAGEKQFLTTYYSTGKNVHSIESPSPTVTTKDRLTIVSSFIVNYYSGGGQVSDIEDPSPSLTTVPKQRIVSCQFMDQQFGQSNPKSLEQPLGTITTNPKYNLISCVQWVMNTNFNNVGSGIDLPAQTITANRKWHYLVSALRIPKKIPAFIKVKGNELIYQIYETDTPVMREIKEFMARNLILDIMMRGLYIPELLQIMGFSKDYILVGTQTEQKKFIGNAVDVKLARRLCEAMAYPWVMNKIAV